MFLREASGNKSAADLYEKSRADSGYVSNFVKVWAWRPDVYEKFLALRMSVLDDTALSLQDITLINATAAATRHDSYCGIAWGAKAAKAFTPEIAASLLRGDVPAALSDRERAIVAWTRAVVSDPNGTTREDVKRLRDVGLNDQAIFEVTFLAATRMAFGTVNDALGACPDGELVSEAPREVLESARFGRPPSRSSPAPRS